MHERTARPPTSTVHAPQMPIPQPYLAPFRFSTSRSTHNRGVSGDTSTVAATLFTFNWIGICSLHRLRPGRGNDREQRIESGVYRILGAYFH